MTEFSETMITKWKMALKLLIDSGAIDDKVCKDFKLRFMEFLKMAVELTDG